MIDADREAVKRSFKEQHGIEVSDEDIDHATQVANEAVQRKSHELALLPLRKHLFECHYSGPTIGLGLEALKEIHANAPQQGSHPWECEKGRGCPSLCTPCAHEAIMKLPPNPDLMRPEGEE